MKEKYPDIKISIKPDLHAATEYHIISKKEVYKEIERDIKQMIDKKREVHILWIQIFAYNVLINYLSRKKKQKGKTIKTALSKMKQ